MYFIQSESASSIQVSCIRAFKKFYELMEENTDVSDFLPESDKNDKEEKEKDEDNLPHFDSEDDGEEIEEE